MASKNLKFCANLTTMFQESSSLLERYGLAKAAGFKAVEAAFPYDFTKEELVSAKEAAGLEQVLINAFPGKCLGFAALVGKQSEFMESLKKSLEYCQAMKCKRLHIMSGKVTPDQPGSEDVLVSNLKNAAPLLEAAGVVGLVEPINPYWVPGYFLNDFDMGERVIEKVNHPNVKLMLDVFHLQYLKGDLGNSIKKYLPITGHVQIAQTPDRHEPDSDGEKNYRYVLKQFEANNYEGWISLEYIPKGNTNDGLKWIQDFGYYL